MREEVCQQCGRPFAVGGKRPDAKFCSRQCQHEAFRQQAASTLWERIWSQVDKTDGCWNWTGYKNRKGYGKINYLGKTCTVPRLVYEKCNGPIPDGLWVLHKCDNPSCVNPEHLYLGDVAQNNRDTYEHGHWATGDASGARRHPERLARGERHGSAKLTTEQVLCIRAQVQSGKSTRAVGRDFGISYRQVANIANRQGWAHV